MRKYATGHEKRKLLYSGPALKETGLDLPDKFSNKISHTEHKKVKEAYFVQCSEDLTLTREQFIKIIRSLGIVAKTFDIISIFEQAENKRMNWQAFLSAYISLRHLKGSFKQVDTAVNLLDKEYNGRWEQLFKDLRTLGDVLSQKQLQIFKQQILGDKILNSDTLKNVLLGYK